MTSKEITEAIKLLYESDKIAAFHVTTFSGHRKIKGTDRKVTVTIRDYGENPAARRYYANASWKGGQSSHEGEGKTIREAISSMMNFWDQ